MSRPVLWWVAGAVMVLLVFGSTSDWLAWADDPFHVDQGNSRANQGIGFHVEPYLQLPSHDGMTIMWETTVALPGQVEYGPTPELGHVAVEEAASARLHQVRIRGLNPAATCYYRVRSGPLVSKINRFRTAPDVSETKWRMAVYGDSRSNPITHRKVVEQIARANVDLILHTGDIVLDGTNYSSWRAEFFGPLAPIAGSVPWVSTIGNHERDSKNYFSYAALPGNERFFSFDFANAHLVGVDSNSWIQRGRDSQQYKWMEEDLKAVRDTAWSFVYFHHPLFSGHRDRGINPLRWDWCPLFLDPECRLDGVLNGHDHFFVRNHRIARITGEPQSGVFFMTTGGGGAPLYPLKPRDTVAFARSVHHFSLFEFDGGEVTISAIDIAGRTIDKHVLTKQPIPSQELCSYDVEELREFMRRTLVVMPPVVVGSDRPTQIDTMLEVPTRFQIPVSGTLRWMSTPGWQLPPAELPFELQPRQPLRIPLQAVVSPPGLGRSPMLTIEFAPGLFRNRLTELYPFKLSGPAEVFALATPVIRLDGKADDEAWKQAPALPMLGLSEHELSRVQLACDGGQLLVFAHLADPHRQVKVSPLGTQKTPSKAVLTGECVRVEIQDGKQAHTFALSPEQIPYHELNDKESLVKWQSAAGPGQRFWTAELAIPLSHFEEPKNLRINVVHRAKQQSKLLQLRSTYLDYELRPSFALGGDPDLIPHWTFKRTPTGFATLRLP
jgi:hypothetical protein